MWKRRGKPRRGGQTVLPRSGHRGGDRPNGCTPSERAVVRTPSAPKGARQGATRMAPSKTASYYAMPEEAARSRREATAGLGEADTCFPLARPPLADVACPAPCWAGNAAPAGRDSRVRSQVALRVEAQAGREVGIPEGASHRAAAASARCWS